MKELPPGDGRIRVRLWDRQYRLLWDSATATTPAYQHISDWCNATIDRDDTRWSGMFYRCPEGVKRWARDDLNLLTHLPNPLLGGER